MEVSLFNLYSISQQQRWIREVKRSPCSIFWHRNVERIILITSIIIKIVDIKSTLTDFQSIFYCEFMNFQSCHPTKQHPWLWLKLEWKHLIISAQRAAQPQRTDRIPISGKPCPLLERVSWNSSGHTALYTVAKWKSKARVFLKTEKRGLWVKKSKL